MIWLIPAGGGRSSALESAALAVGILGLIACVASRARTNPSPSAGR